MSAQRGGPAAGAGASQEATAVEEAEEEAPPAEIEEAEAVEAEEGEESEDEEEEAAAEEDARRSTRAGDETPSARACAAPDAPPLPIVLRTTSAARRCATWHCWLWWLREREPVARGVLRAHVQSCKGPGVPALPVPSPPVRSRRRRHFY